MDSTETVPSLDLVILKTPFFKVASHKEPFLSTKTFF